MYVKYCLFYTYWDFHFEICCLKTQFTAVYSQSNQRKDNFTCRENVSSNHEEPFRSTGFSRLLLSAPSIYVKLRRWLRRWLCKHFEKGFGVLGGKGNKPNTAEAITDEEVSILYMKNLLGITSAEALLNTLWFMNSIHFALWEAATSIDKWLGEMFNLSEMWTELNVLNIPNDRPKHELERKFEISDQSSLRWEKPRVFLQNLSRDKTKLKADHRGPFLS